MFYLPAGGLLLGSRSHTPPGSPLLSHLHHPAGDEGIVATWILWRPRMEVQGKGGRSQDGPQLCRGVPGGHCCPGKSRGQLRGRTVRWGRLAGISPQGRWSWLWWWRRHQGTPWRRWCRSVAWTHRRVTPRTGRWGGVGTLR